MVPGRKRIWNGSRNARQFEDRMNLMMSKAKLELTGIWLNSGSRIRFHWSDLILVILSHYSVWGSEVESQLKTTVITDSWNTGRVIQVGNLGWIWMLDLYIVNILNLPHSCVALSNNYNPRTFSDSMNKLGFISLILQILRAGGVREFTDV